MDIFNRSRPLIGKMALFACVMVLSPAMPIHAQDAAPGSADETQPTKAGVMAVDEHWSLAEMTGDTAWLDQMLLPEYRSVSNTGVAHEKATIIAGAAKRKGASLDKARLDFAAYQKQHPYGTAVAVHGNTAIVSFYDPTLGPQNGVRSSDVFVYVDGHWHALYSQHTAVRG
jgi:hypothetical protein